MKSLLFLLWIAAAPGPVAGAPAPSGRTEPAPPRPSSSSWSASVAIERLHDDNILQLTKHDADRFAANSSPPRFLIESTGDNVSVLHGNLRWRPRLVRRRETRFAGSLDVSRYDRNPVKNWEEYGASLEQELTASRRALTTVRVWGSRVPDYYLRQITDEDDSFDAGVRIRRPLRYAETELGARLSQELARGRVEISGGVRRRHRDYDGHFNERDNDNDEWTVAARGRPVPGWGLTAGLSYVAGALEARGDLAASAIRDADISYDHRGLGGSLMMPWVIGGRRGRVQFEYAPETRAYTTTDKFDLTRFDRTNFRRETTVTVTQRVWGAFDAIAEYQRLTSDARFPDGVNFSEDVTDFEQTRFGLTLRAHWDLRGR